MNLLETLKKTGMPATYKAFLKPQTAPFVTYIGAGQEQFEADNKTMFRRNLFEVQLYFTKKMPEVEEQLEDVLIDDGWIIADKSADTPLDSQDINVIYYTVFYV